MSINWPSLVASWFVVQKIYSKMHLVSCTNTHRDVTDLVNHGMVKNTKTWISWERNIIFLQNKKILNQCFRWHILRSYCFVVVVTFKYRAHPSILAIKKNCNSSTCFNFSFVDKEDTLKEIKNLKVNKATQNTEIPTIVRRGKYGVVKMMG